MTPFTEGCVTTARKYKTMRMLRPIHYTRMCKRLGSSPSAEILVLTKYFQVQLPENPCRNSILKSCELQAQVCGLTIALTLVNLMNVML